MNTGRQNRVQGCLRRILAVRTEKDPEDRRNVAPVFRVLGDFMDFVGAGFLRGIDCLCVFPICRLW